MFLQMWHVGRISHTTLQPNGAVPISSTDQPAENAFSFAYDAAGNPANVPVSTPRIATLDDLLQVIADYGRAARYAREAGFDGAEIHGANGYLFDQFLNSVVNQRTDEYGRHSKETRTRLLLETFDAVAQVLGPDRVGVRIAPFGNFGGMLPDPKVEETFLHLAAQLSLRRAAYVHIVRGSQYDPEPVVPETFLRKFRNAFTGTILVTGGLDREKADHLLNEGLADLFGFGMLYISNPDLVERFRHNWPLTPADRATLYGGTAKGYTDYPTYQDQTAHREVPTPLDIH
jgi:2,4-dienoyl-CoA reductase-like NADH-dependent reductase (Old Yellow Enzyme family)